MIAAPRPFDRPVPPRTISRVISGPYVLLHTYLDTRFADTVVLTFAQVEDILGFRLPEEAVMQLEWWTGGATGGSHYSDAWTLAQRSAEPNLGARTVSFRRAL